MPRKRRDSVEGATEKATGYNISGPKLAERLRAALVGTERARLMAESGIANRTITRALKGEPTRPKTLRVLAEAAGVSAEWLIHGLGEMRPPHWPDGGEPNRHNPEVLLDELQRLTDQQRLALRTCIVAAHNVSDALKRRPFPPFIAETALDLFDFMCMGKGPHRDRLLNLEAGIATMLDTAPAVDKSPASGA